MPALSLESLYPPATVRGRPLCGAIARPNALYLAFKDHIAGTAAALRTFWLDVAGLRFVRENE